MEPRRDPDWIRWAILALGLGVVWMAYLVLFGPSIESPNGLEPPQLAGTGSKVPVDFRWTLRDLDDKPVPFTRFQGRTVVVNIWATWCPPCRAEMPSLAALAMNPKLKEKGIEVVCISTDESPEALRQFVAKKDWKLTMLRATDMISAFLSDGIPATFILAPDGRVAASELGAARWDDPSVVDFLENLAAKTP